MAVAMTSRAVVTDSPTLRAVTLVSLFVLELESGKIENSAVKTKF